MTQSQIAAKLIKLTIQADKLIQEIKATVAEVTKGLGNDLKEDLNGKDEPKDKK